MSNNLANKPKYPFLQKERERGKHPRVEELRELLGAGLHKELFLIYKNAKRCEAQAQVSAGLLIRSFFRLLDQKTELLDVAPLELGDALRRCAALDLTFDLEDELVHVWRGFKKKDSPACVFSLGVRGVRLLAARAGYHIDASVIYRTDEFRYIKGTKPTLFHAPDLHSKRLNTDVIGCYAFAQKINTPVVVAVINGAELEKKRAEGEAKGNPNWGRNYEAMCLKTAIKRLFKDLPCLRFPILDEDREAGETGHDYIIKEEEERPDGLYNEGP